MKNEKHLENRIDAGVDAGGRIRYIGKKNADVTLLSMA
jgi:hypothetical protein